MARHDILPVAFSELTKVKLIDLDESAVSFFVSDSAFAQILDGEVQALKFIQEADVSQSTIS